MNLKVEQIQVLADRILVQPDETADISSIIKLPENAQEKPQIGTVVSSGLGTSASIMLDPDAKAKLAEKLGVEAYNLLSWIFEQVSIVKNEIKKGDRVIFGKYAGQEIEVNGTKYLVMREADVIGIIGE